jgi:exonuclease III
MDNLNSRSNSGTPDSMADSSVSPEQFAQIYQPNHKALRQSNPHFVVFNTGDTTAADFYRMIELCLGRAWLNGLTNVQRVDNRKTPPRIEFSLKPEVANAFRIKLRETFRDEKDPRLSDLLREEFGNRALRRHMPKRWRVVEWQPYTMRRSNKSSGYKSCSTLPRIITWNINGFASKKHMIEELVGYERPSVLMLQESLHSSAHFPLRLRGYYTFSISKKKGFRGQAILLADGINGFRIPHAEDHILHVKISQWKVKDGSFPLHIFSLYLPSGGNRRGERKKLFQKLCTYAENILSNEEGARVLVAGDMNESLISVSKRLRNSELNVVDTKGSNLTRFPKSGTPADLDHFVTSDNLRNNLKRPRVLRSYNASDHKPVMISFRDKVPIEEVKSSRPIHDRREWNKRREEIVNHNRWTLLQTEDSTVDDLTERFNKEADSILRELGVKKDPDPKGRRLHYPRKLRGLFKAYQKATLQVSQNRNSEALEGKLKKTKARYRKELRRWRRLEEIRDYTRVGEDIMIGDLRSAWTRLDNRTHQGSGDYTGMPMKPNQPLRDEEGKLETDPKKVAEVLTNHYKSLHQADKKGFARNPRYWEATIPEFSNSGDVIEQESCPELGWRETLLAIRAMNRDTAPGKDELHINMFKALVREESMAQLKVLKPGRHRWEGIQVDLPAHEMPDTPRTRLGKAVYNILQKVWNSEEYPSAWETNEVISLFKSGDPEVPSNYRGITLISVFEKVLSGVIMHRMYAHMEHKGLFDINQGGFRPGEEAVAQFIALAEVVRRRYKLGGLPTYVAFIDLKKAYDKVPLELVLLCLKRYGFNQKYINLIRNMYKKTKIAVRTGSTVGEAYDLQRGLRQGCLLSPILFIVFINNLLGSIYPEGGVGTPGHLSGDDSAGTCEGLLYADDIAALQESIGKMEEFLKALDEWCKYWWMELGITKCGIMLWSDDPEEVEQFQNHTFTVAGGEVPKVESYKYLGIKVDDTFGDSRNPIAGRKNNEEAYVASLVSKGLVTLHQLRPTLINPHCPIPIKVMLIRTFLLPKMLYGAEWLGLRQLNSEPLQRVVNIAAHWTMGLKAKSNLTDSGTLCMELGIPDIEEEMVAARARLYYKYSKDVNDNSTWLSRLVACSRNVGAKKSWVFTSRTELYKILTKRGKYSDDNIDWANADFASTVQAARPLRQWAQTAQSWQNHMRSNAYRSSHLTEIQNAFRDLEGLSQNIEGELVEELSAEALRRAAFGFDAAWERTNMRMTTMSRKNTPKNRFWEPVRVHMIRDCVRERGMTTNVSTTFRQWYDHYGFGINQGFLRSTMRRPDLMEGVKVLVSIRTRFFPSVRKNWIQSRMSGNRPSVAVQDTCPLCTAGVEMGWEWCHLLLKCRHDTVERARLRYLGPVIQKVADELQTSSEPGILDEELSPLYRGYGINGAALGVYLVGGTVGGYTGCSWTTGFGSIDLFPLGENEFGWIPVASFLQVIFPVYCGSLRIAVRGNLVIDDMDQ